MEINATIGGSPNWQGHMVIDYAKILEVGITGLRDEIVKAILACIDTLKLPFYQSLLLLCDNLSQICLKYASKAMEIRKHKISSQRSKELLGIAKICKAISKRPPKTFREAVQLYWFTFLCDCSDDAGRIDQFLYPFYHKDIASGEITRESAKVLLTDMWYKMEQTGAWGLVLGGQTKDGSDAGNDLTYLCLEITRELKLINPAISLRTFHGTPKELWKVAMDCIATGGGMPALLNDDAITNAMVKAGISVEDARDYAVGGCIELQISGKSDFGGDDGSINLAKCLELALNDGVCRLTGQKIGISTGDPHSFGSFQDIYEAYKKQVEWAASRIIAGCNISQEVKSRDGSKLFRSLLVESCIERGLDCDGGGALYGNGQILTMGIAVVADSLAVLKYLVFERNEIYLDQLLEALENNWKGYETLRQYILHHAPRYGNDDERVDSLASGIARHLFEYIKQQKTHRGGHYTGLVIYYMNWKYGGDCTGATPDGRFSGDVLEDSIGPWPGRDLKGPTSMLKSVASIPQELASGGMILNMKLVPDCFENEEITDKTIALIKSFFAMGGQHIQITVINNEDLEKAIQEPEKWQHLIVRVGGFSDYFTRLHKDMQKEILNRTQHGI